MNTIPVVIVDEHPLIRTGMEKMMLGDPKLVLCGEAVSGDEVVEMCERLSPQLILVGIDVLDGTWMNVIGKLRAVQRDAKIVVIGAHENEDDMETILRAGADAYLAKHMNLMDILRCLQEVLDGRRFTTTEQAFRIASRNPANLLTPREMDILAYLATGMSNKLIAHTAGICVGTVKFHVKSIMSKLDARTRTEATVVAARRGLVHLN